VKLPIVHSNELRQTGNDKVNSHSMYLQ